MFIRRFVCCLSHLAMITALGWGTLAWGQTGSDLEEIVVTGAHIPVSAGDLTAEVTVLGHERIAELDKLNVIDLLARIPGVTISRLGGPGSVTNVFLRGGEPNFTVVMVDGIQTNDSTNTRGGSFDVSLIDPAQIERIEVIRGAQSSVYGSDALSGVINIITASPGERGRRRAHLAVGEQGLWDAGVTLSGSAAGGGYALSVQHQDLGTAIAGNTLRVSGANGQLEWDLGPRGMLRTVARFSDSRRSTFPEQSGGPRLATVRDTETGEGSEAAGGLDYSLRLSSRLALHAAASWYRHREDVVNPGIAPFDAVPPNRADTEFSRSEGRVLLTVGEVGQRWGTVGIDYQRERGVSDALVDFGFLQLPNNFSIDRNTVGLVADLGWRATSSLLLNAAVRRDDPDVESAETGFRAGLRYDVGTSVSVTANAGRGYKLPSFFALASPLIGNPDLKPEFARSLDAGVEISRGAFRLYAGWFANEFSDLIDFDPVAFTNVNRAGIETHGVEFAAGWRAASWALDFAGSYIDTETVETGVNLLNRPRWTAVLTGSWQPRERLGLVFDYSWTDDFLAGSRHTGATTFHALGNTGLLALTAHYRLRTGLDWHFSVDNALDRSFEPAVGFPGVGRRLRTGLRMSF